MNNAQSTEPIFLCSGYCLAEETPVKSTLFGQLVKLAAPLVEHYHGDFYHDADWIRRNVTEPMTFFFGADDCGTAIGTDEKLMARANVWRVALACRVISGKPWDKNADGIWTVEITELRLKGTS